MAHYVVLLCRSVLFLQEALNFNGMLNFGYTQMINYNFEWNPNKARLNQVKHGISFAVF